jgi:V8-like Glu-specific endopeptidase
MTATQDETSEPLRPEDVTRLTPLPAEGAPPERLVLNVESVWVPPGATPRLVAVPDSPGQYRIEVETPGTTIGALAPERSIPAEDVSQSAMQAAALDRSSDGYRPAYLPVNFLPGGAAEPAMAERREPPADLDYQRDGETLDRPNSVFAPDSRVIFHDTSYPWSMVGRVDTPLGYGTGCMIYPRLLLTCSHIIQWQPGGGAGWVRFRPAYYNGSAPFGEAWAVRTLSWVKVNGGDGVSDFETAFDYVVCVLDSRIGDTVGYAGYRTYDSSWNGGSFWQLIGYPSDLSGGQRPSYQSNGVISSVGNQSTGGHTGYVLGNFNDTAPGQSGGPVWGWWGSEIFPRVIGVDSTSPFVPAPNTSGDNEHGGGPAMSDLIAFARTNYP